MSTGLSLDDNSLIRLVELKPHLRDNQLLVRFQCIAEWAELVLEDSLVKEA